MIHFPQLGRDTSIKNIFGDKLALWTQTSILSEMNRSSKCFLHESKMSIPTNNRVNSFIIKNAIILNIMHTTFNLHDIYSC
jgi:hypothetical protein